jgi:hypothetical protein
MDNPMKSKMTNTTVFKCFAFGAIGISFAGSIGCHCKSNKWNPFYAQHASGGKTALNEHQVSEMAVAASNPKLKDLEDVPQERSGLLVDLKNALAQSSWRTRIDNEAEDSANTESVAEFREELETQQPAEASATIQSSRRTALTRIENNSIHQPVKDASKLADNESETKSAATEEKDHHPDAKETKKIANSDRESSANSSKVNQASQQLNPVAKSEPTSETKPAVTSSSTNSIKAEPKMQPIVKELSPEDRLAALRGQDAPNFSPANSESSPHPMALPRATAKLTQQADSERINPDPSLISEPFSNTADSSERPLVLDLRDGDWPISGDVDPVSRAYQTHKKSKSQFRTLDSQATGHPNQASNPTMHRVGHRRRVADTKPIEIDEAALLHDRSNWVPVQEGTKQMTGLELQATPKSSQVAISPIVQLKLGSSHSQDHVGQPVEQPSEMELQPQDWLPKRHFDKLLPLDDVGPIIDLPVSDSVRRLTVRPAETGEEKQTIER